MTEWTLQKKFQLGLQGKQECGGCRKILNFEFFSPSNKYMTGYESYCKTCLPSRPRNKRINIPSYSKCQFSGCVNTKNLRLGYCRGHRSQQLRGEELRPLRKIGVGTTHVNGEKWCPSCSVYKKTSEFGPNKRMADNLNRECKKCVRVGYLKTNFGIDADFYDELLVRQGGTCFCGRELEDNGRMLAVDHDRNCCPDRKSCGKCVRGILCANHNLALGLFNDDPKLLRRAASYLEG